MALSEEWKNIELEMDHNESPCHSQKNEKILN